MAARIEWISVAPVKGMRMQALTEVEMTNQGAVDDRQFFLIDRDGEMVSATRLGPLLEIIPEYLRGPHGRTLALTFPDGSTVEGPVELDPPIEVSFYGLGLEVRPVAGAYSEAISRHCGTDLRLVERPENRPGVDRGSIAGATLLGFGSLERLQKAAGEAGQPGEIDQRRFRMNFGISGIRPHEEDDWMGDIVGLGEVRVQVHDRVGRCAATTRDPDAGNVDLKTLHHIRSYRGDIPSEEPLPFGVYASVRHPGIVRLGDAVTPPAAAA